MPSYRSSSSAEGSTGTTLVVTKPTGVVADDVLLAMQKANTLAEMTTPSGWSLLDSGSSNTISVVAGKVWIKTAGGSEPASYTFNKASGDGTKVIIVAIQDGTADGAVFAHTATGNGTSASSPGVTPLGDADVEIRFVIGDESA